MLKDFCRVSGVAMVVMALFLFSGIVFGGEPPTVDGFIGVPWGASRQGVQKAMEERGFTLLEQRADGFSDTYRGTFTGQPAELEFLYEKNVFFRGEVTFLHISDKGYYVVKDYYNEIKDLLTAKYGLPVERTSIGSQPLSYSTWENLPATTRQPGQVRILLREGPVLLKSSKSQYSHSVIVSYDIGVSWARQIAVKDIKDL